MADSTVTKPLGVVLIVAAHMVFNVHSQVEVTGILGTSITLQFTFNVSITNISYFALHTTGPKKIAGYKKGEEGENFGIYPENKSVCWHIRNLKINDSGTYWVSFFPKIRPVEKSNEVQLIIRKENRSSSTASPWQSFIPTTTEESGSSTPISTVLLVSPLVLLVAVLPGLIWCLMRTNDKQEQAPPQPSPNLTIQETVEASTNATSNSLIYSVLDFPKRPSVVLEVNASDTEYAAVSYLPESRRV